MKKQLTKKQIEKRAKRLVKRRFKEELSAWKTFAKERDNYTCQLCGKYLKNGNPINIQVHHILPNTKKYISLATNPMNAILLCSYCHNWSPDAPHHNSLFFTEWLRINRNDQYKYLVEQLSFILGHSRAQF